MSSTLSPNTQAILLLTAPLIVGRSSSSEKRLTSGEYRRLARCLVDTQHEPADLLGARAKEVLRACRSSLDEDRVMRLLERGLLLGQAIEGWSSRAIWVVSRADDTYPLRIKSRLRDAAPSVLYGSGDASILDSGGIAVVGSRQVDDALIRYTEDVGRLSAEAGQTLVSGGARGIDQAAMRGASEAGGRVTAVLANDLERTALNRDHRNLLSDGQIVLVSPYDPSAGFNVGNAMHRNKLIYAFSDAALIMNSDVEKGGTWAGAAEQLKKLHLVPIFVRSTDEPSQGLDALRQIGAKPWPNPTSADDLLEAIRAWKKAPSGQFAQKGLPLVAAESISAGARRPEPMGSTPSATLGEPAPLIVATSPVFDPPETSAYRADELFDTVREPMLSLLKEPRSESEVSEALQVTKTQARDWLERLIDEGTISRSDRPVRYRAFARELLDEMGSDQRIAR